MNNDQRPDFKMNCESDKNPYSAQPPYNMSGQRAVSGRRDPNDIVAPVTKRVMLGFVCGIAAVIIPFFSAVPFYLLYTEKNYRSPWVALSLSFLSVVLALAALLLCVQNGNVHARAGKQRGALVIVGTICSIIGLVISAVCFSCTGTISIMDCNGGSYSESSSRSGSYHNVIASEYNDIL